MRPTLKQTVDGGAVIVADGAAARVCTLRREEELYVMRGPKGRHCLAVSTTPAARLLAHWNGFLYINRTYVKGD